MTEQFDPAARDGLDFEGRLDDIERRIAGLQPAALPEGLTEPDPGADERWEAAQVWAHMAEFVAYWHDQIRSVIGEFAGEPIPFGRVKTNPERIAAIEVGRHRPVEELIEQARRSLDDLRRDIARYGNAEWNAVGLHPTLGEMDVERMVERFVVSHLEEHLDQLEGLGAAHDG